MIAGALTANNLNILSARITTRTNGIAMDVFRVSHQMGEGSMALEDDRWLARRARPRTRHHRPAGHRSAGRGGASRAERRPQIRTPRVDRGYGRQSHLRAVHRHRRVHPGPRRPAVRDHAHAFPARPADSPRAHLDQRRPGARRLLRERSRGAKKSKTSIACASCAPRCSKKSNRIPAREHPRERRRLGRADRSASVAPGGRARAQPPFDGGVRARPRSFPIVVPRFRTRARAARRRRPDRIPRSAGGQGLRRQFAAPPSREPARSCARAGGRKDHRARSGAVGEAAAASAQTAAHSVGARHRKSYRRDRRA